MTEENLRKGPWYEEEDEQLKAFVAVLGAKRWDSVARISGLKRSGKSCRLRWLNYLRPSLKHGAITPQEEQIILKLHERWGNKWAKIARRLPGRTDNEVKNYWRTHQRKKEHTQYPLLHYSTSSPSTNISWGETSCSSNDHTSKKGEIPSTTPEISSNDNDDDNDNDNDNDNKKIMFLDETNYGIGAMISSDYDNDGDNQKGLLSDCMIMNSPYENRLSDWMNMLSKEIGDKCSPSVEEQFCLDDPMTWCFLGDGISAWDFIDTNKWDLDLFSVNN